MFRLASRELLLGCASVKLQVILSGKSLTIEHYSYSRLRPIY